VAYQRANQWQSATSGRCLYASALYITDENCSCIDYRLVSDRNYMMLYTTYAAVGRNGAEESTLDEG